MARRPLDTGDEMDFIIPLDQPFTLGYANNDGANTLSYGTKHQVAGSVEITLSSDGTPVWSESVEAEDVDNVSTIDAIGSELTQAVDELFNSGLQMSAVAATAILASALTF